MQKAWSAAIDASTCLPFTSIQSAKSHLYIRLAVDDHRQERGFSESEVEEQARVALDVEKWIEAKINAKMERPSKAIAYMSAGLSMLMDHYNRSPLKDGK